LEGAASAINAAGIGVKASVINDRKDPDRPYKLMISGDSVGGDHRIEYPKLYLLDGDDDLYFDSEKEAKNGLVKVDGFEFEIGDNTLKDLIPGVNLDIKQASPGRTVNVTVKENREAISTKVNEFIQAMNDTLGFLQAQSRMDANTDTSKTLGGDSIVRSTENRLRRLIQDPQYGQGNINRLNQMGIEFTREGVLKLDEEKFNNVLLQNPEGVRMFFAGDGFNSGFIPAIRREISTITNSAFGQVAMRKKALQDNIKRIDDSIETKERQLVRREQMLREKFSKLEQTMSKLKSQGGALGAAQMYQGPSFGGAQIQG
jgi:flagellar hook-associated protein 2